MSVRRGRWDGHRFEVDSYGLPPQCAGLLMCIGTKNGFGPEEIAHLIDFDSFSRLCFDAAPIVAEERMGIGWLGASAQHRRARHGNHRAVMQEQRLQILPA